MKIAQQQQKKTAHTQNPHCICKWFVYKSSCIDSGQFRWTNSNNNCNLCETEKQQFVIHQFLADFFFCFSLKKKKILCRCCCWIPTFRGNVSVCVCVSGSRIGKRLTIQLIVNAALRDGEGNAWMCVWLRRWVYVVDCFSSSLHLFTWCHREWVSVKWLLSVAAAAAIV